VRDECAARLFQTYFNPKDDVRCMRNVPNVDN